LNNPCRGGTLTTEKGNLGRGKLGRTHEFNLRRKRLLEKEEGMELDNTNGS